MIKKALFKSKCFDSLIEAFGHMPETSIIMFDKDMRYLMVEGGLNAEKGYSHLKGKTVWEIAKEGDKTSVDDAKMLSRYYQRALDGESFPVEILKLKAYPNEFYKGYFFPAAKNISGKVVVAGGVFQNITSRVVKQESEKYAAHKERERAMLSKISRIFSKVFVEIKTITRFLMEQDDGQDIVIRGIHDIVKQGLNESSKMLVYSQRGHGEELKKSFDICSLVEHICRQKEVEFSTERESVFIYGHRSNIKMALSELIDNCKNASKENYVSITSDPEMIQIHIRDYGSGITVSQRGLEPYAHRHEGSGIGIPLANRVINDNSGTLEFRTNKDGTSVYVYFSELLE